jgi:hypothetical protein
MRIAVWVGVASMALFAITTIAYRARVNSHGRLYLPALAFLQQNVQANDLVMATGEFGVGLGFEEHVLDDHTLGYGNKIDPDYFVVDEYWPPRLEGYKTGYPDLYRHLQQRLATYEKVHENRVGGRYYEIYRKPGK